MVVLGSEPTVPGGADSEYSSEFELLGLGVAELEPIATYFANLRIMDFDYNPGLYNL